MITCLGGWNTHQNWRNLEASKLIHAYTNSAVIVMGVQRLKWSMYQISLWYSGIFIQSFSHSFIHSFIRSFIHSFIPQLPGPATWIHLAMPSHPPIRPSASHLKDHNGYTKQFKALIKEDISSVVLALFCNLESGPGYSGRLQILTSSNRKDWTPTTNFNPWLQHTAQKKIGMSADGSFSGSWNSALISLATKFMSHAPSDHTSGM